MATLQFRSSDKFHDKVVRGPNAILTVEEEDRLEEWMISCQVKGFPLRIEDVQESVKGFLDRNPRENPFANNMPGRGWHKRRDPDTPLVPIKGSNIYEKDITKWFSGVGVYLARKGYSEFSKAMRPACFSVQRIRKLLEEARTFMKLNTI
ncbi:hypothetical protein HHI36_016289 [Cryptolaemus montrouzieri]|uniref:Uncharacterized protein n=1 Tax=Cryptolaemus montrouzieri TaxID=559131 RepID=A0ABD2NJ19_9CUCU